MSWVLALAVAPGVPTDVLLLDWSCAGKRIVGVYSDAGVFRGRVYVDAVTDELRVYEFGSTPISQEDRRALEAVCTAHNARRDCAIREK